MRELLMKIKIHSSFSLNDEERRYYFIYKKHILADLLKKRPEREKLIQKNIIRENFPFKSRQKYLEENLQTERLIMQPFYFHVAPLFYKIGRRVDFFLKLKIAKSLVSKKF